MKTGRARNRANHENDKAVVWIDRNRAVIVDHGPDGRERVELLGRASAESKAAFEARALGEIVDRDRVVVSGPSDARTGFERAYVAATHRPDRLIDVEPKTPTSRAAREEA